MSDTHTNTLTPPIVCLRSIAHPVMGTPGDNASARNVKCPFYVILCRFYDSTISGADRCSHSTHHWWPTVNNVKQTTHSWWIHEKRPAWRDDVWPLTPTTELLICERQRPSGAHVSLSPSSWLLTAMVRRSRQERAPADESLWEVVWPNTRRTAINRNYTCRQHATTCMDTCRSARWCRHLRTKTNGLDLQDDWKAAAAPAVITRVLGAGELGTSSQPHHADTKDVVDLCCRLRQFVGRWK